MSRRDDDLSRFRDDPLFQALTGPATPDELSGEAEALAAFRAATASRPRRRFAARVGTSGAVAAAAVALSGGVAAAYTASFPAPVQRVLHVVIDAPAPKPDHPKHSSVATAPPSPSPVPPAKSGQTPPPTSNPSPHTSSGTSSAKPTASASPAASTSTPPSIVVPPVTTPGATGTPNPTSRPPLPGASFAITVSDPRVNSGDPVDITGTLDSETGTPVVGREVVLLEHLVGEPGWTKVGEPLATDSAGEVAFTVPGLDHNAHFQLRAGGQVHTAIVRVAVKPSISTVVTPSTTESRTTTVTVNVNGGEPGDVVVLTRVGPHHVTRHKQLDSTGEAVFTVPVPLTHAVQYHLLLPRTEAHTASLARVVVLPPVQPTP